MFGMVIYANGKQFAAVSPRKRALKEWTATHEIFTATPAPLCNWRLRDTNGWCDGGPNAENVISAFPATAEVLW
jgi:hypothetical protein